MSAASDVSVVIARGELLPALRERLAFDPGVLVFSSAEAAHVLGVVVQRHMAVVALDRQFADSRGGASFVADLRTLRPDFDVRVLTDHGSDIPIMLRKPVLPTGRATIAAASQPLATEHRRTPRYPVTGGCEVIVNGESTPVVDVSVSGAQMLSPAVLRPLQHVRVALPTDTTPIRLHAAIAWSMFERRRDTGQTCYRVGIEFDGANGDVLAAFCSKLAVKS